MPHFTKAYALGAPCALGSKRTLRLEPFKTMFLSPPFNQISLDFFCFQETSSKDAHLQDSSLAILLASTSSRERENYLSFASQKPTWLKAISFLIAMLLKTSLFQTFKLDSKAFSLKTNTKLHEPLIWYPIHHLLIKSLNPPAFNRPERDATSSYPSTI